MRVRSGAGRVRPAPLGWGAPAWPWPCLRVKEKQRPPPPHSSLLGAGEANKARITSRSWGSQSLVPRHSDDSGTRGRELFLQMDFDSEAGMEQMNTRNQPCGGRFPQRHILAFLRTLSWSLVSCVQRQLLPTRESRTEG